MRIRFGLSLLILVSLGACGPKLLPGTDVRDTDDNRQILEVMSAYRSALEARNPPELLKLVSPTFFENSGTPSGDDDYDFKGLSKKLTEWVGAMVAVRVDLQVKKIGVEGDLAKVAYYYELNYQIRGPDGVLLWKRDSDSKEMRFHREGGQWRIVGGV